MSFIQTNVTSLYIIQVQKNYFLLPLLLNFLYPLLLQTNISLSYSRLTRIYIRIDHHPYIYKYKALSLSLSLSPMPLPSTACHLSFSLSSLTLVAFPTCHHPFGPHFPRVRATPCRPCHLDPLNIQGPPLNLLLY